jgi:hypothetical protein
VIDRNRALREWHCPQVASFSALCRELTGTSFGELSRQCAEAVLKNYSIAFFTAGIGATETSSVPGTSPPGRRIHACTRTRHAPSGRETPGTA